MLSGADMSRSRVYLDTWVLVGLASGDRGERNHSKWQILKKLTGGAIDVVVPQVVLGEAVAAVMRKNRSKSKADKVAIVNKMLHDLLDNLERMPEMPSGDPEGSGAYGKPGVPKTAELTVELCGKEFDLEFADALILAHALADPHSTHLITDDGKIRSYKVKEFEKKMRDYEERERELSVTNRFS